VRAGDEAVLRGADDEALRRHRIDCVEARREFIQRFPGKRVGRLALLVEGEPDEALRILLVAPVLEYGFSAIHQAASTSIAPPRPPPMQIEAMPRFAFLRFRSCSMCRTILAPDAPTGWPSATAPPSTFNFSWSSSPRAASRPSCSLQYFSSFH